MAVDRQRLAEALAYEEQKRRMMESVPTVGNLPPAQPVRRSLRTDLENLSSGLGQGIVNQLEGVKGLVTDPVGTVKGAYEGVKGIVRDPSVLADALRYTADKAMSGPLGAGEVVGEMLGPMRGKPPMAEIDVYHGSPHRFEEFDASKIGTGEGAQAYGHGIYVAEAPDVAKGYAKGVKDMGAIKAMNNEMSQLAKVMAQDEVVGQYRKYKTDAGRNAAKRYDELMSQRQKAVDSPGNLYTADLPDEMVDRMLDWDKPLSEQSPYVQKIIGDEIKRIGGGSTHSGEQAYKELMFQARMERAQKEIMAKEAKGQASAASPSAKSQAKAMEESRQLQAIDASERLRQLGIPGIKYLDAGSRGQGGTGTRNFVVFPGEEKKVKILKRE
jgi:hypothetical protein